MDRWSRGADVLTFDIEGLVLRIRADDDHSRWYFGRHVEGRYHEDAVVAVWLQSLSDDSRVLDIGCHVGWYTCLTLLKAPEASVAAFDLDSRLLALCGENLVLNGCSRNSVLVHAAVTDHLGRHVTCDVAPTLSAIARVVSKRAEPSQQVRCVTIDSWCSKHALDPTLVKVDVEGGELQALRGMRDTLGRLKPTLFVEVHPSLLLELGLSTDDLVDWLVEKGYRVFEIDKMKNSRGKISSRRLGRESRVRSPNPVLLCEAGYRLTSVRLGVAT